MFKQVILLIVVSLAIVFFMPYAHQATALLIQGHDWVAELLTDVFAGGQAGNVLRGLLAILCIPIVIGLIPSIIYWGLRRHWFPYFMEIVWVIWLLQVGALTILYKSPVTSVI